MNSFNEMGLDPLLNKSLETLEFTTPTPIQAQTIPLALEGKDILGSAQTGTGKTLAFVLPLVNRLLNHPTETALVLVPTRELAQQVATTVKQVIGRSIKTALLIGGESPFKQLQQLRSQARILVGTPGRIIDHLKRDAIKPASIHFLVLDETDRMFDMGFESQIETIISQLPQDRQTLMFSATIPSNIIKTASRYLDKPERVAIGGESNPISKIKQEVIFVNESEKEAKLIEQLAHRQESIVIFVKTKWGAEKLAEKLATTFDYKAIALHGDLRQNKRERVIGSFRRGTHTILVATDIAARGLDIPQVRHIINYDLPQCPEDYIHRIGRTARAGAEGFSLCLVTPKENKNWKIIDRFANTAEGISDSDRASLSQRERRGGSFGGSRGGRSFGSDRSRGDRGSSRPSFKDRGDRRPSFDRGDRKPAFGRSYEKPEGFEEGDRPARPARDRFERLSPRPERRPFTDRRPSSDGFRREDTAAGKDFASPRATRSSYNSGYSSDRSSRPFSPRNSDGGSFPRRSSRPSGDRFKKDGDFGDAARAPRKPYFEKTQDDGDRPPFERKNYERGERPPFARRGNSSFDKSSSPYKGRDGFQKRDHKDNSASFPFKRKPRD